MATASDAARQYSRANGDRFVQELIEMLRIPSLSGDPAHAGDIRHGRRLAGGHLTSIGVDGVQIMPTAGHPVVYGEWLGAGPDKPTVLVYGHYDVVPGPARGRLGYASRSSRSRRTARSTPAARPTTKGSSSSTSRRWSRI